MAAFVRAALLLLSVSFSSPCNQMTVNRCKRSPWHTLLGYDINATDPTIDIQVDCSEMYVVIDWTSLYKVDQMVIQYSCSNSPDIVCEETRGYGHTTGRFNFTVDYNGSCTYSGCVRQYNQFVEVPTNFTAKTCARNSSSGNTSPTPMESSSTATPEIASKIPPTSVSSTHSTDPLEHMTDHVSPTLPLDTAMDSSSTAIPDNISKETPTSVSSTRPTDLLESMTNFVSPSLPLDAAMDSSSTATPDNILKESLISVSSTHSTDPLEPMTDFVSPTLTLDSASARKPSRNPDNRSYVVLILLLCLPVVLIFCGVIGILKYRKRMDIVKRDTIRKFSEFSEFSDNNESIDIGFLFQVPARHKLHAMSNSLSVQTLLEEITRKDTFNLEHPKGGTPSRRPHSLPIKRKEQAQELETLGHIMRSQSEAPRGVKYDYEKEEQGNLDHVYTNALCGYACGLAQEEVGLKTPENESGRNTETSLNGKVRCLNGCTNKDVPYIHWDTSAMSVNCCNDITSSLHPDGVIVTGECLSPGLLSPSLASMDDGAVLQVLSIS